MTTVVRRECYCSHREIETHNWGIWLLIVKQQHHQQQQQQQQQPTQCIWATHTKARQSRGEWGKDLVLYDPTAWQGASRQLRRAHCSASLCVQPRPAFSRWWHLPHTYFRWSRRSRIPDYKLEQNRMVALAEKVELSGGRFWVRSSVV